MVSAHLLSPRPAWLTLTRASASPSRNSLPHICRYKSTFASAQRTYELNVHEPPYPNKARVDRLLANYSHGHASGRGIA